MNSYSMYAITQADKMHQSLFLSTLKPGLNSDFFFKHVYTYPNSGTAVKCKGLDLPILQKHLQHVWYE